MLSFVKLLKYLAKFWRTAPRTNHSPPVESSHFANWDGRKLEKIFKHTKLLQMHLCHLITNSNRSLHICQKNNVGDTSPILRVVMLNCIITLLEVRKFLVFERKKNCLFFYTTIGSRTLKHHRHVTVFVMDGEQELGILVVGVLKVLCNLYNQTAKLSKLYDNKMLPCSETGRVGGGHQTIVRNFPEKAVWYQPGWSYISSLPNTHHH